MTEQQIKNLQELLNDSSVEKLDGSTDNDLSELDAKLLNAAKQYVPVKKASYLSILFERFSFRSFGFINAMALSVMLTLGLLFVLGQLTQLDDSLILASGEIPQGEKVVEKERGQLTKTVILDSAERPVSMNVRDQILLDMKLPDAQILVNEMQFSLADEKQIASVAISNALFDIRLMINDGELNNARQRYERLRKNCVVCVLPNSLEAVVLNFNLDSNRSS